MNKPFYKNKFLKGGLPFIIFVVGASFALQTVTQIRYRILERRNNMGITPEIKKGFLRSSRDTEYSDLSDSLDLKRLNKEKLENLSADPAMKNAIQEHIKVISKQRKKYDPNDPEVKANLEKLKKITGKKLTLEDEYNKMRETANLNNWENKRISRPYEE